MNYEILYCATSANAWVTNASGNKQFDISFKITAVWTCVRFHEWDDSATLLKTSLPLQAQFSAKTRAPLYRLVEWNPLRRKFINLCLITFKSTLRNVKQNSL